MAKKSIYLPTDVLEELQAEAHRLDRSLSWVIKRAWLVARQDIKKLGPTPCPQPHTEQATTKDKGVA